LGQLDLHGICDRFSTGNFNLDMHMLLFEPGVTPAPSTTSNPSLSSPTTLPFSSSMRTICPGLEPAFLCPI
jgi:hypothetical protein